MTHRQHNLSRVYSINMYELACFALACGHADAVPGNYPDCNRELFWDSITHMALLRLSLTPVHAMLGVGKMRDGSHLPVGWEVHLEENILPSSPKPERKSTTPAQKKAAARGEVPRKRGPANASLEQQHVAKKPRPTPPQCDPAYPSAE